MHEISIDLEMSFWLALGTILHIVSFIGVCLHALDRRRNASATFLWIFVGWNFPILGPLLYLAFGVDRIPHKGLQAQLHDKLLKLKRSERHESNDPFIAWHFEHQTKMELLPEGANRAINHAIDALTPEHHLLDGNYIEPLICGDEAYPLMLDAIRGAKHHIHIQSFIIQNDDVSKEFITALKEKALEGVTVRLLFDRFGSTKALWSSLFNSCRNIPNFHIVGWTQANPFKRQFQVNLRNHRKNLVVDGALCFFGGVNISSDNRSTEKKAAIRDYHFKATGPIVHELQYSFMRDWYFMTSESINNLLQPAYFPEIQPTGACLARILDTGPSSSPEMLGEAFFNAIISAKKQIIMVTPYFVPTQPILTALRAAARRGIDVRIILPKENNHFYAGYASKALYESLLESKARIFERKPPFIHAKAMVIDDEVAFVGTANMDIRSLELNYETTVLLSEEHVVNEIKRNLLDDLNESLEIQLNEWVRRPHLHRLIENLCSLLTPLL